MVVFGECCFARTAPASPQVISLLVLPPHAHTALKEIAKDKATIGRYFCSLVVRKDGLEGGALMVANPTKELNDRVDEETLAWLAATMNQGKADYAVEQAMKKKRIVTPS